MENKSQLRRPDYERIIGGEYHAKINITLCFRTFGGGAGADHGSTRTRSEL
jgi:hypothetical protein